jgi:hypothetical protein
MATFLVRALGLPAGSASFTDIGSSVHAANIEALASAGITKGCNPPDNTLFCPTAPVTREQMATFLARALHLHTITPLPPLPADVPGDLVVIGAHNWLYFAETLDQICHDADVYARLVAEIEKAHRIVTATNREFVYAIPPNKVVVYPDTAPGFDGSCAESNSDLLQAALTAAAHQYRVDLWDPFAAASAQLYWKHDTHWNVDGALLGSELIASKAAPGVWDELGLVSSPASRQGDLATLIGVDWLLQYDEQTPTLAGVTPSVDVSTVTISNRPLVTYTSPSDPVLPDDVTVVIHDSFGMFFRNKLGPLFEKVTFIPTFSHPLPDVAAGRVEESNQVVIEVVERNVLRDFLGAGMAGALAASLSDSFAHTAAVHQRIGESVTFTIPAAAGAELRYLIVELDTSGLSDSIFIGDPNDFESGNPWPDEIAPGASLYGFETLVDSGPMQLPLPSSVTVSAAYVVVVE